jgi:prefoldin subunit 5
VTSTETVSELQKQNDKLSKELRELDEKIQELNWTTELQ